MFKINVCKIMDRTVLLLSWFSFQTSNSLIKQEIQETGRMHYQLLKERGNLPQYGSCWRSGIINLEKGCKFLTEESQSEIALHLANCFLAMSGHDTYNCHYDKKSNLRSICINNMSDRAFSVYTEFYTHTQNICGFLQGHIWHEIIAENTMEVGKRLKETAQNQKGLLEAQKESLKLQEKMLRHGRVLENILEDLFVSFKENKYILGILSQTVSNLQDWIVGEMSWFESVVFYTISVILVFIVTSSYRTHSARLVIYFLLFLNFLMERLICSVCIFLFDEVTTTLYSKVYNYIWLSRYGFIILAVFVLVYVAIAYNDYSKKQYKLLCSIQKQNTTILKILQNTPNYVNKSIETVNTLYLNNANETITSLNESINYSKDLKNTSNNLNKEFAYNNDNFEIDCIQTHRSVKTVHANTIKNYHSKPMKDLTNPINKVTNYNLRKKYTKINTPL